ncbi:MAG: KOW domain-containing RNA-binding protein [Clostridia bacterium]|nr:KOW domain-containing RNA-binding protein [Clostridia bacterium]
MEGTCIGSIVRSLCGRDRKRLFVITGVCKESSDRVLIADGELHPLSKPKMKNLRHLAVLAAAKDAQTSFHKVSDSELKKYLCDFEEDLRKGQAAQAEK